MSTAPFTHRVSRIHSAVIVFNRTLRLLTVWIFVALQTMTPFIHAHAGDTWAAAGDLLQGHQKVHLEAGCQTAATHEHGAEVDVSPGIHARKQALVVPGVAPAVAATRLAPQCPTSCSPGAGIPDAPPAFVEPAHSLPPAFAPPSA